MGQKNTITKEQHFEIAKKIRVAYDAIWEVEQQLWKMCGKTHNINKKADKLEKAFSEFKCALDSDYHKKITDAEFQEHGNIYYKSEE